MALTKNTDEIESIKVKRLNDNDDFQVHETRLMTLEHKVKASECDIAEAREAITECYSLIRVHKYSVINTHSEVFRKLSKIENDISKKIALFKKAIYLIITLLFIHAGTYALIEWKQKGESYARRNRNNRRRNH